MQTPPSCPPARKRFRKLAFRTAAILVSLLVAAALVELGAMAFARWKFGTTNVGELQKIAIGNDYVAQLEEPQGYRETLYPHPYLGYVMNEKVEGRNPQQTIRRLNNVGLLGRDIPLARDPSKFTVLLTGGSVACHFGIAGEEGRSYLEIVLNDQFDFGREVVVLNGAAGSWKQPQQAIMALLYGNVVDAVVTLDGANEGCRRLTWPERLEYPANNFYLLNPIAVHGLDSLGRAWQIGKLDEFVRSAGSRAVYFATRGIRNRLADPALEETEHDRLAKYMALPEDWSDDERYRFNIAQYQRYIRAMFQLASSEKQKCAFFVQPCPAIGKTLTPEERKKAGDLSYAPVYRRMTDDLLTLNNEGIPVVSLLDVYDNVPETVYADKMHPKFDGNPKYGHPVNFGPSEANRMLAVAMGEHLARLWSIPRRSETARRD